MKRTIYILLVSTILVMLHGCGDDGFPVPPASTVPKFSAAIDNNEFAPATVTFTNESVIPERAGEVSYAWSFGDGASSTEADPVHVYESPGVFNVNLVIVTSSSLEINELTQTIVIKDPNASGIQVFFTNGTTVFTALINDQPPVPTSVGTITLQESYGITVDTVNNKLYIPDYGASKILVSNLDGSDLHDFRTNIGDPDAVAIDYEKNQLYWDTDSGIRRANLDDDDLSQYEDFVTGQTKDPEGIAIDPVTKTVFWNNYNNGGIWKKKTDGTGEAMIIPPVGERGGGGMLVINDRIYYDQYIKTSTEDVIYLKSAKLDGSGVTIIASDISRVVYGIAYDKEDDKIYWVDRDNNKIMRANTDGTGAETWYTGVSAQGLVIGNKKQ